MKTRFYSSRTLWVSAGVIIAALVVTFWPARQTRSDVAQDAIVRRGDLNLTVPASGSLVAGRSVDIGAPTFEDMHEFKVARLAPEGVQVQPGQMLMELDGQDVMRNLMDYQAEMNKTQEELNKKRLEYDIQLRDLRVRVETARVSVEKAKHKVDVDPRLMALQDHKQAQIELAQAEKEYSQLTEKMQATQRMMGAELAVLENTLAKNRLRLERAQMQQKALTVKAPIAGVLIYRRSWNGEKKQVGQSTCSHDIFLQIPDLSTLRLEAMIEESDAGRVRVGQAATIRLDAFPELQITGRVTQMGTVLRTKRWDIPVKIVDATIELDRQEGKLLPGMTAQVEIEVERVANVLLAPVEAVHEKAGRAIVRIRSDSTQVERPVRVGRRNRQFVEILQGVGEGEKLVL